MRCELSKELNSCPYYDCENGLCCKAADEQRCAFQESKKQKTKVLERKERWYEKYYK